MSFDFQSNPALVEARARATSGRDRALAQIQEGRRQALINFGSQDVARGVLGANDPTVAAISSDPDKSNSVLAQIARGNRDTVNATDEALNQDNLFYSGHRAKTLANLATEKLRSESAAEAALRQQLSGFTGDQGSAEEQYRQAIADAQQGAYGSALDQALQYGIGPAEAAPPPGPPGAPPPPPPPGAPAARRAQGRVGHAAHALMRPPRPPRRRPAGGHARGVRGHVAQGVQP